MQCSGQPLFILGSDILKQCVSYSVPSFAIVKILPWCSERSSYNTKLTVSCFAVGKEKCRNIVLICVLPQLGPLKPDAALLRSAVWLPAC